MTKVVNILRRSSVIAEIKRRTTVVCNVLRRSTVECIIDMPVLIPAPLFVSAEVGLIDAYTIDVLFDRTTYCKTPLNVDVDPDVADFALNWSVATALKSAKLNDTHLYLGTGANDLYLPSYFEVTAMYTNLKAYGVGGFTEFGYWSSSQGGGFPDTTAYKVQFSDGNGSTVAKTQTHYVRACRTFTSSLVYALRDSGPAGGWIFNITNNGNGTYTYLEAAPSDQSSGIAWSNITDTSVGATGTAIGTGQSNTTAIIGQTGHTTSAAKLCDDLVIGRAVEASEAGTIQYTPGTNKLQGVSGALVAAFTESVTNNVVVAIPVLVPPIIIENAAPTKIKVPYDIALDLTSIPATSAYVLSSGRTVITVEVFELYVLLTASSRYYWGDSETVAYTKPGTNMIKSTLDGEADSFTATAITNQVALDAATTALIAVGRYTDAPTDALKALINKTIVDGKEDGWFQLGDAMYIRGVHESLLACQNWIKNAHNSDLVNNPTFTGKQGFKSDGVTSYIINNYTPSTQAVQYALNDCTIVFYQKILSTINSRPILGSHNSVDSYSARVLFYTASNELNFIHSIGNNNKVNIAAEDHLGYVRSGTSIQGYKNGNVSGTVTTGLTATGLPIHSIMELTENVNGNPSTKIDGQISFTFYGKGLTAIQMLALYTRIAYFFANVGGTF